MRAKRGGERRTLEGRRKKESLRVVRGKYQEMVAAMGGLSE